MSKKRDCQECATSEGFSFKDLLSGRGLNCLSGAGMSSEIDRNYGPSINDSHLCHRFRKMWIECAALGSRTSLMGKGKNPFLRASECPKELFVYYLFPVGPYAADVVG